MPGARPSSAPLARACEFFTIAARADVWSLPIKNADVANPQPGFDKGAQELL